MDRPSGDVVGAPPGPSAADAGAGTARRFPLPASPGWLFHLVLGVVAVVRLWAASAPAGGPSLLWVGSSTLFAVAAVAWGLWLVTWARSRRRDPAARSGRRFVVAPVGAIVFFGVLALDVPLHARWSAARASFDRVIADAPPPLEADERRHFEVPARLGTYRVDRALRVGENVFVHVKGSSSASFVCSAGFAHLPAGPASMRGPLECDDMRYRHLRGDWYAWTAAW